MSLQALSEMNMTDKGLSVNITQEVLRECKKENLMWPIVQRCLTHLQHNFGVLNKLRSMNATIEVKDNVVILYFQGIPMDDKRWYGHASKNFAEYIILKIRESFEMAKLYKYVLTGE